MPGLRACLNFFGHGSRGRFSRYLNGLPSRRPIKRYVSIQQTSWKHTRIKSWALIYTYSQDCASYTSSSLFFGFVWEIICLRALWLDLVVLSSWLFWVLPFSIDSIRKDVCVHTLHHAHKRLTSANNENTLIKTFRRCTVAGTVGHSFQGTWHHLSETFEVRNATKSSS